MSGLRSCVLSCALAVGLGFFTAPADARLLPAELTASFSDRALQQTAPAKPIVPVCTVNFTVADERRSPDLIGVIGKRAIKAPADGTAWLNAVLTGFPVRGIAIGTPAVGTEVPTAKLILQTAWIDESVDTYNASVVIALHVETRAGAPTDHIYRGRATRTLMWSAGVDTLQSAMDGAFANALDQMAVDMRSSCAI